MKFKLKIGPKLIGGFLIVAALVAIAAGTGIWNVGSVAEQTDIIAMNRVPQSHAGGRLQVLQRACRGNLLELALVRTQMEQWSQYKQRFEERAKDFDKWCQALLQGSEELGVQAARKGGKIEEFTKEAQAKFADFQAIAAKVINCKQELLKQVNAGKLKAAEALADKQMMTLVRQELRDTSRALETPVDAIAKRASEQMEVAVEEARTVQGNATTILWIVLCVAVAAALGLGFWIARSITKPVNQLRDAAEKMAQGETDVQLTITSRDELGELGQAFRTMRENIRGLLEETKNLIQAAQQGDLQTRGNAEKFAGGWGQLIGGVNDLLDAVVDPMNAATVSLQAMSDRDFTKPVDGDYTGEFAVLKDNINSVVRNVSDAIGQITESAAQFNEGSRVIAESSQTLASGAQEQSSSVEQITASVEELSRSVEGIKGNAHDADKVARETSSLAEQGGTAVQKSVEAMDLIKASSDQIAEIIQVIANIASQTNLLALNAAIEAARAGEHGMGFAVVADEVRKLAERSNEAAGEISSLIKESGNRVEEGARLSQETGDSLTKIVEGVEATSAKIAEIATATVQQASNAEEVSKAIQGVSEVTEQSAAGSEQMASSSEELGAQSAALKDLVNRFKTNGNGHAGTMKTETELKAVAV